MNSVISESHHIVSLFNPHHATVMSSFYYSADSTCSSTITDAEFMSSGECFGISSTLSYIQTVSGIFIVHSTCITTGCVPLFQDHFSKTLLLP